MNNLRKIIKLTLVALLVAVTFISAAAQDNDEVVITPQLQAALEKYDYYSSQIREGLIVVSVDYKYGYINVNGEEIIPCRYDDAYFFVDGLAVVAKEEGYRKSYGVINTKGEVVAPFKYCSIDDFNKGVSIVAVSENNNDDVKYGLINTSGEEILPCEYDDIKNFDNNLFLIRKGYWLDATFGLVNMRGQIVLPCEYKEIEAFKNGTSRVRKSDGSKDKYGIIDESGELVVSCEYDFIGNIHEGLYELQKEVGDRNKYGIFNSKDQLMLPCEYDYIGQFENGYIKLYKSIKDGYLDKVGLVNAEGKFILPCEYGDVFVCNNGLAIIQKGELDVARFGVINNSGEIIVPCKYYEIRRFYEDFAVVRINDKWGLINTQGKEVVPCEYDFIEDFNDGVAKAIIKGQCGTIDANGTFSFSHNIAADDLDWLVGDWNEVEIINGREKNDLIIVEQKGKRYNAKLVYDSKTGKYVIVSNKKTKYYVDLINQRLTYKDCTYYSPRNMKIDDLAISSVNEFPSTVNDITIDTLIIEYIAPYEGRTPRMIETRQKPVEEPKNEDNAVYSSTTTMPSFPGGTSALNKYMATHVQYPKAAQDANIQGKVIVQFVVEKDGSVGEVKVARGVDKSLDQEAVRVCKTFPKFNPGKNANGDPVRVWYTVPVVFKLQGAN